MVFMDSLNNMCVRVCGWQAVCVEGCCVCRGVLCVGGGGVWGVCVCVCVCMVLCALCIYCTCRGCE